jgi:isoquinoline 1-oxidoreductase beta subunit
MAVDPGIALQPHNIVAQMESNIIYGLSQSIKEQVTLENGAVQQSNFHDYEVFRMADVPNVEVKVMPQGGGVCPVRSARWDCHRRRARSPMPCAPLTVPM